LDQRAARRILRAVQHPNLQVQDIFNSTLGINNPLEQAVGGLASLMPTVDIVTQNPARESPTHGIFTTASAMPTPPT